MTPKDLLQTSTKTAKEIGIYMIYCHSNNKAYIGSSINITSRVCKHKAMLRNNYHQNSHLQSAWNKYGEHCFMAVTIESMPREELIKKEKFYIDSLGSSQLFNQQMNPGEFKEGHKHTSSMKEKIIKLHTGNKYNLGRKHTDETKKKWSEQRKGQKAWNKGIPMKEWCANRKVNKGNDHPNSISSDLALEVYNESLKYRMENGRLHRGSREKLSLQFNVPLNTIKHIVQKKHFALRDFSRTESSNKL